MADLPDMSHLTPEERRIIEGVMMRQKEEEERENEIMRRKQDEVQVLEETIRARSEKHKQAGIELDATCHICMKTKFADGVGHICNYCNIRCCARCGGKVTLRSNKVIWVCILCRKKQELLSKTGQWMVKSGLGAADTAMLRRMQEDMQDGPVDLTQDKRPKLERAHSAAEKENLPLLQRSGSALKRQYSQQEQIQTRRMSTSDSGVEMSVSPHSRSLPTPHVVVGSYPQQTPRHPGAFPEDDPSLYRGELDGLMKQHAQTYQRSRQIYQEQNSDIPMSYPHSGVDSSRVHSSQHSVHQAQVGHPSKQPTGTVPGSLHQQRSFSSSEEERSTPECPSDEQDESEKGDKLAQIVSASPRSPRGKAGDRINRQTMLDEKMKKFLAQPGQKTIGHMILRKSAGASNSSNILGLKVVGGMLLEDGRTGALIEKVKKGSIADRDGQLRPGDEVIEWNGHCLQGKSFQEVADIISESREEPQVELIVARNLSGSANTPMMSGVPTTTIPMTSRGITMTNQWRQRHEPMPIPQQPHHKELYDVRRDKPSVLVTSPGSPDLHAQGRGRHPQHSTSNAGLGGKLQVKLGYDPVNFQLIVTIVCAAELTPRSNSQPRSPYARMYLLPDTSEKTKRRTKTLHNTNDPKWNETFVYNVRKSELKYKSLEVTVWDNVHRYGTNDFLGEAILELTYLNEKPQWHFLLAHDDRRHIGQYQEPSDDIAITPVDYHLSPPSTTSRLSDSDTSEYDITDCDVSREQRRTADGASISSIGSSSSHYSSPPPERELCMDNEHRSRRDMSPQGRKRAALMISRDHPVSMSSYQPYRKDEPPRGMMGHRSHSAAPMDSPNLHYRGRSQSPTGHRSLSPPEHRSIPYSHGYVPARFGSRSATATPTGSPKKRQLPQIPAKLHAALKERVAQDHEERARLMKHRNRQVHTTYRSTGMGGWERHYSGLSDSDLLSIGHDPQSMSHAHRIHRSRRGHLSPDKDVLGDFGDSDMESIASVASSSAFSTQSERPRGSRTLIDYASPGGSYEKNTRHQVTGNGHSGHTKRGQFSRSLSNADVPPDEKTGDGSLSDTAVGLHVEETNRRGRKSSPGSKSGSGSSSGGGSAIQYQTGLGKKSNSTSQLSATECGAVGVGTDTRVTGLSSRKRNSTPSSFQRSQEVVPTYQRLGANKQAGSVASDTAGSLNSISSSEASSWSPCMRTAAEGGQLSEFIDGLGPGQLVGRQVLGASSVGDIQLALKHTKGYLEVEVVRARDLQAKSGSKVLPAPWVKVYLVNGKKCVAKAKTTTARKTLEPFYQQTLAFREDYHGCVLQVVVWGDYGRLEARKVFMGVAQIMLDDINLSEMVFGWYKLFGTTSLVSGSPSLALSRRSSAASLDSLK